MSTNGTNLIFTASTLPHKTSLPSVSVEPSVSQPVRRDSRGSGERRRSSSREREEKRPGSRERKSSMEEKRRESKGEPKPRLVDMTRQRSMSDERPSEVEQRQKVLVDERPIVAEIKLETKSVRPIEVLPPKTNKMPLQGIEMTYHIIPYLTSYFISPPSKH